MVSGCISEIALAHFLRVASESSRGVFEGAMLEAILVQLGPSCVILEAFGRICGYLGAILGNLGRSDWSRPPDLLGGRRERVVVEELIPQSTYAQRAGLRFWLPRPGITILDGSASLRKEA